MKTLAIATISALSWFGVTQTSYASSDISTYIYNGEETTTGSDGAWPSIASLYYDAIDYTGIYGLYCGASILDNQHVLTAAHCLYDGEGSLAEEYLIYTSVVPQMQNESQFLDGSVDVIRASAFYIHSGYEDSSSTDGVSWPNDIAIIKLAEEMNVDSSDYVTRATTTNAINYLSEEQEFIAVGHGLTETGNDEELLQTTLTYQSDDECDLGELNGSQLCMTGAYNSETEVNNTTCSGDSGGPLYWDSSLDSDSTTNYVQAGITSYGWTGCYNADSSDTSVYTEVADYNEWITNVLAGNETADYTLTDEDRDDYYTASQAIDDDDDDDDESESSSSGGSIAFYSILSLLLLGFKRRFEFV